MSAQVCLLESRLVAQGTKTVHALFAEYAQNNEHHSKLIYADKSISYAKLHRHSDELASALINQNIQIENLVGVLMERSIDAIVSQLGVLKAGGAYLPLAPNDYPLERIEVIFEDAQVNYVVTQKKYKSLVEKLQESLGRPLKCLFIDDQNDLAANEETNSNLGNIQIGPDNLAYVMYTSGSTGKPKGVMITHRNIVSTVKDTTYVNFCQTDSVLHAAPISFDAATFEIWGALLNGLDLHIIPEKVVHDFNAFADYVRNRPISIAWLTSALFNLLTETRPDFFEFLSQLMVGGEALSAKHINRIRSCFPHLKIRNNYGPTENTIFSTSFLIEKTYNSNIPIGSAIIQKRAYILNENMEIVPPYTTGVLHVAGEGLARGYLNLPAETREKFVPDPFFKGERMYFTGDLCRYNEYGEIEYIGRIDDQVKILGHRIELGEVESILRSCPQVNQAVVLHKNIGSSLKGMAAYVDYAKHDWLKVKAFIDAKLPQYMIPGYFEKLSDFPITSNGKVDRQSMLAWPIKNTFELIDTSDQSAQDELNKGSGTEEAILAICGKVLGLNNVNPEQNFFGLGGDSLSGTRLIIALEQALNIELPMHVLYENPVMGDFVQYIENARLAPEKNSNAKKTPLMLAEDAQLDFDISLNGRRAHIPPNLNDSSGHVFLTGATGFFGSFLIKELLSTTKATLHCLVRARDTAHAQERIYGTLKQYKISLTNAEKSRIIAIPGDLTKKFLGLDQEQFDALAGTVDMIFHNGAAVNYVDSYSTLKKPNVFGSQEVIRLACHQRIIPLQYISSISVFETLGFFTGREMIYENEGVEDSENYVRLGYSQSKWVAEKMMENARDKGLPINIFRSAYIMGHSETGVSNTTDHIARYIAGCIEMGAAPVLEEYASLAPVDQLSRVLSYVATHNPTAAKTFHLCNPSFITVGDIYQKIQDVGFPLALVSYSEWKERLKKIPETNPLYPLLSLHIHEAPGHELTLPELYERNTRFDCSQLIGALEGSGIQISMDDPAITERWLYNYAEAGLISEKTFAQVQRVKLQQVNG